MQAPGPRLRRLVVVWWRRRRRKSVHRLGEILLHRGLLTSRRLELALSEQKGTRARLGQILLRHGWVTRLQLLSALSVQRTLIPPAAMLLLQACSHVPAIQPHAAGGPDGQPLRADVPRDHEPQPLALKLEITLADAARHDLPAQLLARADEYLPYVQEASHRFNVPAALLLGVMHVESHFKSGARSPMNAHGLMQLVPASGGREAYPLVFDAPGTPSLDQLRDPRTNIFLGAAYLQKLDREYFRHILDAEVREASVIAAYNLGPTRLRRIFLRHGKPRTVANLRELLDRHAPVETVDYLAKVSLRRRAYEAFRWSRSLVRLPASGQRVASALTG